MKRVVIADGGLVMREGFRQVVSSMTDCGVVEEASNPVAVMQIVRRGGIDLLMMSSEPAGLGTARLISAVLATSPGLQILIFGPDDEPRYARRAILAGARGYVSERCDIESIQAAISKVAAGGGYVSDQVRDDLIFETLHPNESPPHSALSPRELQIFVMLANGRTVTHIANCLHLSAKTVSTHKMRLLARMNLSSLAKLVQYAIGHNLIGRN